MSSRADEIRRKMAKRKKERDRLTKTNKNNQQVWPDDEERYGFSKLPSYDGPPPEDKNGHPLFRKEVFFFKVLASACLFLIVAIMFKNESDSLAQARAYVEQTMEKSFQFAAVSKWYEDKFGTSFVLLPTKEKEQVKESNHPGYALPASAKILEEFEENGQRISIETNQGEMVAAMNEGLIEYAGEKEGFGKTVIIQHADQSQSWYGNLDEINVKVFEYIKKGTDVGQAASTEDGKGLFYFAIKKGDEFVDPFQVIPFD
ncbi:M23 family metallopeptidase [Cytobacillus purgationiresistens]|uniref:Stage IV sporulation protein FA n=1 Tax=Cytobacillus purgationiresistens TaxID=863449 RepID=A0ABU0AF69_9BACI|nr:M23 family metallopeptidase [Cytobacillus purgationiresistens]MDQ0269904.1 stage IV sporulation protein FA [Cytobacillus purgationiresistens]